ncbi:MAG TPA: sigma-54 dependent transcriptional regulator [Gemmataceae bacterium]|nr:sigma-54 dependent transcriptional regulator [Gemmataceae bacterium]
MSQHVRQEPANDSSTPLSPAPLAKDGEPVPRRILIVEDNETARRQLQQLLQSDLQLQVDATGDGNKALHDLAEHNYSIVITDLRMPRLDGMELIKEVQQRRLPVTIIVTTGHGSIDEAVQAIRLGAYDFLTKPIDVDHLRLVVQRALRERTLQDEVASLREQLKSRYSFHNILSKNPHMHAVFELISNVAHTNTTVLIEGETGTGKEQVARAIHQASANRTGPLIAVNCAALPETLLESELFGHEKGAFTSAVGQRRGRFEMAHGGTIFLDEVGDVPATMQAKLLRVLQERRFERVGGTDSIEVDVRVLAATNRSLQRLVKQGTFREDLYYRLNVVKIDLPPLRERLEDIPLLATHFAEKYARPGEGPRQISPRAMDALLNYHWPGNIRELENAIERACVTSRDNIIQLENLPPELVTPPVSKLPLHVDLDRPLPDLLREAVVNIEQQYLRKALKKTRGNVGRCARICGLSRRSITAKIAEYKLDKAAFKDI